MTKPVGPYTPIVEAGPWLICSGQVGIAGGALVDGGVEAELRQAMANMAGLLEGEGASMTDVVKTTVFLTDMADYGLMNEVYVELFRRPSSRPLGSGGGRVAHRGLDRDRGLGPRSES